MTCSTLTRIVATLTLSSSLVLTAASAADARSEPTVRDHRTPAVVRDHRRPSGAAGAPGGVTVANTGPVVRDHRRPTIVRDHRTRVVIRDHRGQRPVFPPGQSPRGWKPWGPGADGYNPRNGCPYSCPIVRDHRAGR